MRYLLVALFVLSGFTQPSFAKEESCRAYSGKVVKVGGTIYFESMKKATRPFRLILGKNKDRKSLHDEDIVRIHVSKHAAFGLVQKATKYSVKRDSKPDISELMMGYVGKCDKVN